MNIQEYISTGIVQAYVLGLASREEVQEFEKLAALHPELQQAREAFERSLEQHAMANGVPPPIGVKVRFLEAIGDTSRQGSSIIPPKIITMENVQQAGRPAAWPRYVAAASLILLAGVGWMAYRSYQQNNELKSVNTELQAKYNTTDSLLKKIVDEQKAAVADPNVTVVNMVGTQAAPKSSANIYWDSTKKDVYLVVRNMPRLPNDKQYQLWALIDGKPKDLGTFDANDDKVILKMKNTQKADAFAITIEQRGGAPSPTLEKMQSMGKLKTQ